MHSISAGLTLDRTRVSTFMISVCTLFAVFHTALPFTNSFHILCLITVFMEFFMGMLDTGTSHVYSRKSDISVSNSKNFDFPSYLFIEGCNVGMLRLWGAEGSGPYFTALHFFFGIGNTAGPVLAEVFLGSTKDDIEKTDTETGKKRQLKAINILEFLHISRIGSRYMTFK